MIYKYKLDITDHQSIKVGDRKARPLSVAEQRGELVMWVMLDEDYANGDCMMDVQIIGTGNLHPTPIGDFVGTVPMSNGLVWHIFAY